MGDELCHLNKIVLYSILKSVRGGVYDGSALDWPPDMETCWEGKTGLFVREE